RPETGRQSRLPPRAAANRAPRVERALARSTLHARCPSRRSPAPRAGSSSNHLHAPLLSHSPLHLLDAPKAPRSPRSPRPRLSSRARQPRCAKRKRSSLHPSPAPSNSPHPSARRSTSRQTPTSTAAPNVSSRSAPSSAHSGPSKRHLALFQRRRLGLHPPPEDHAAERAVLQERRDGTCVVQPHDADPIAPAPGRHRAMRLLHRGARDGPPYLILRQHDDHGETSSTVLIRLSAT